MRKPTKSEIFLALAISYCIIVSLITPSLIGAAYMERGYFDFGGEILPVWSIPFVLFGTVVYYFTQL